MLSGALWCLLSVLAALVVFAGVVIMSPVKLGFTVRTSPIWRLKIAARLLGGLTPPILIHDSARRRPKKKPASKNKKSVTVSREASTRISRAIAGAPRLLTGLLRPIRLERLSIDADIGLGDPADTGQLFGILTGLSYSLPPSSPVSITMRPDFTSKHASGELTAALSFTPLAFIPPGIRFAWHVFGSSSRWKN